MYNQGTSVQFHCLLCELIKQFEESLQMVLVSWGSKSNKQQGMTKSAKFWLLDDDLEAVMFFSSVLYRLATGSAIENT
jgi:hypothetical protein